MTSSIVFDKHRPSGSLFLRPAYLLAKMEVFRRDDECL